MQKDEENEEILEGSRAKTRSSFSFALFALRESQHPLSSLRSSAPSSHSPSLSLSLSLFLDIRSYSPGCSEACSLFSRIQEKERAREKGKSFESYFASGPQGFTDAVSITKSFSHLSSRHSNSIILFFHPVHNTETRTRKRILRRTTLHT